jgi:murein DD-endopeptidase MepM/ murein hydrolase activator NlpD
MPALTLALGVPGASRVEAQIPPAIEFRVPKPPTVATNDSGAFVAYELHVTNTTAAPMILRRVEVVDGNANGGVLATLQDTALWLAITRPGVAGGGRGTAPAPLSDRAQVGAGLRAILFLWVRVDQSGLPATIGHRLALQRVADTTGRVQLLSGAVVPVGRNVAVIRFPLRGDWVSANGLSNTAGHRRTIVGYNGQLAIGQRFGADFLQIGEDGRTFKGDSTKNESYYAYGTEILAVADGIVVETKDSIPQNVPRAPLPVPSFETVGGNHIVLDIGQGHYAFYAHVQPGSLRVRVGDRVKRGQVIALLGNSGNSTEPHLHFHLVDAVASGSSTLGAEGIPYAVEEFEIIGRCSARLVCTRGAPVTVKRALPPTNGLLRFPK